MDTTIRPGMLIQLRRRLWRVEDVAGGVLTAAPIDDFSAPRQRFLIELENPTPGTLEDPPLDNIGDHGLQQLFLQAVRLDALHGTAPFVSIQRVGVIPAEYQLVPLIMALRQRPVRLLIADTIGLGKTIETGIIAKELLARNMGRSVLIITPKNLREQWQEQMRDLFYLDFEIFGSETRRRLERAIPPGADPWLYFDRIIVSVDYAKTPRVKREILKRKWDIVIVDEAHNMAMPHLHSGRKADMERWELVDNIAARASEHLLLLTATPHNGYTDSYSSLLKMLSPKLVQGAGADMRPDRSRAVDHVCQRTRHDIQRWFEEAGKPFPFPQREADTDTEVPVTLMKDYQKILNALDDVLNLVSAHAQAVGKQQPVEWLRLHFHRRALSSPAALRISLENRIKRLQQLRDQTQEGQDDEAEENLILSVLGDRGLGDAETEDEADRRVDAALLRIDQKLQLTHFALLLAELSRIKPANDKKLTALRDEVIPALLAKSDEQSPRRVIIFTRYYDTLEYLEKQLGSSKKRDYEVFILHGDLSEAMRNEQFRKFATTDSAVLIATDVISEGMNLQGACCKIVHYDIPWNPNRMEQRVGRVDRYGQRAPIVYVRTVFCRDTHDEDVLDLYLRKFKRMRTDLGATPPLFASEDTVKRVLMRRTRKGTAVDQLGLFDDQTEDRLIEDALNRIKSDGFFGQANVRITDVSERLAAAYERVGSPAEVQRFLQEGLRLYGCSFRPVGDGMFKIEIHNPRLQVTGLPRVLEKAAFDPNLRQIYPDVLIIDVGHPLARRLSAIIREDALRLGEHGGRTTAYYGEQQKGTVLLGQGLLRATAKTTPPTLLEEVVTFVIRSSIDGVVLLSRNEVDKTLDVKPTAGGTVDRQLAVERMQRLAASPVWQEARTKAEEDALSALREYRSKLLADLTTDEDAPPEWLDGFAEVEFVGFDLYCLTLVLPEAK